LRLRVKFKVHTKRVIVVATRTPRADEYNLSYCGYYGYYVYIGYYAYYCLQRLLQLLLVTVVTFIRSTLVRPILVTGLNTGYRVYFGTMITVVLNYGCLVTMFIVATMVAWFRSVASVAYTSEVCVSAMLLLSIVGN
jgi:hypothetical protein